MPALSGFIRDSRLALRLWFRTPLFTAAAVVTLALGIGANTALFSVIKRVLLDPLPYRDQDRLAMVWDTGHADDPTWISLREVLAYREATTVRALGAYTETAANLTSGDEPERVRAAGITTNLFDVLGVAPAMGHGFRESDGAPGAAGVVVMSHALWQRRFGGDQAIVGKSIEIEGRPRTVLGVMPAAFRLPLDYRSDEPTELWLPITIDTANLSGWGDRAYFAIARLADASTAASASAEFVTISRRWVDAGFVRDTGDGRLNRSAVPMREFVSGGLQGPLLALLAAVGCVLLVACANVVNLLLARADSRRHEIAVRAALGASSATLVRQSFAESLTLAGLGGLAGLGIAQLGLWMLVAFRPAGLAGIATASLDPGVLSFAAAISLLAALIVGIMPALRFSRAGLSARLRESTRATPSRRRRVYANAIVAGQLACSVVLVVCAGLLMRTLVQMTRTDLGFRTDGVLTAQIQLPLAAYPQPAQVVDFYSRLLDRAAALPSVSAAGAIRILPLSRTIGNWSLTIEGRAMSATENVNADFQWTTPGYFAAMKTELLRGRFLASDDRTTSQPVAVINETLAARYWQGQDALGRRFKMGTAPERPWITVVGITKTSRHNSVTERPRGELYLAHAQLPATVGGATRGMGLVLRTTGDPLALARPLRDLVHEFDPKLPVSHIRPLEDIAAQSVSAPRFAAWLVAAFAVIALMLAAIGAYGTVSLFVAQRTQEIGIRLALGAERGSILRMVLRQGLLLAGIGIALGLTGAAGVARLLRSWLYGVEALDPLTFAAVPAVLVLVTLAACVIPARRAARLDPIAALRGR